MHGRSPISLWRRTVVIGNGTMHAETYVVCHYHYASHFIDAGPLGVRRLTRWGFKLSMVRRDVLNYQP